MRGGKSLGKLLLKDGASCRVRARLEESPQARTCILVSKPLECLTNGRGMMAEVIDDSNAADHAAHFLTSLDPLKCEQGLTDHLRGNSIEVCRRDSHRGIADIELP